jgi:hypothetical protein
MKKAMDFPLTERLRGCDTAGWEACATTLECRCVSRRIVARLQRLMAIMASKPRALPWAVLWRPFRPYIRTAMLEKESHGFSIDGTAQGLRYGRLGSLRYDVGMPLCQQKNGCALTALDGNYGIKTQGVALGCPVAAFQALYSHRHAGRRKPWI